MVKWLQSTVLTEVPVAEHLLHYQHQSEAEQTSNTIYTYKLSKLNAFDTVIYLRQICF